MYHYFRHYFRLLVRAVCSFFGARCKMLFGGPYFLKLWWGDSEPSKAGFGNALPGEPQGVLVFVFTLKSAIIQTQETR